MVIGKPQCELTSSFRHPEDCKGICQIKFAGHSFNSIFHGFCLLLSFLQYCYCEDEGPEGTLQFCYFFLEA